VWFALSSLPCTPTDDFSGLPTTPTNTLTSVSEIQHVQIRGRVVCVPEEMCRLYGVEIPPRHEHVYGLRAVDGRYYLLLRTRFSEAIFSDERVREKELVVKGRLLPNSQILDPLGLSSIREGVVSDLYYFCDICNIRTVAPGPCDCCQGPTELVEKPRKEFH